jgi:hypothetical protein
MDSRRLRVANVKMTKEKTKKKKRGTASPKEEIEDILVLVVEK